MIVEVVPLKFGVTFKRVFGKPDVFQQFASDILGIPVTVDKIQTEYEYPKQVGFVRSRYDLFAEDTTQRIIVEIQHVKEADFFNRFFYYHLISLVEQVKGFHEYDFEHSVYTIVVLTSVPKDGSVNFSCAISDFSPIDEHGRRVSIYPHRLVFLVPRLANADTPPAIRKWLAFIEDSLDGKMDENIYKDDPFHTMLEAIRDTTVDPDELAVIKDEAAWELAKKNAAIEERAEGLAEGLNKGKAEGLAEGLNKGKAEGLAEGLSEGLNKGKAEGLAEGLSEGLNKGKAEGRLEGEIAVLRRLLVRRFGALPKLIDDKLNQANIDELEHWSDRILEAKTLQEVFM